MCLGADEPQFNEQYELVHEIFPKGAYNHGDMHEFTITPDNTALLTLYHPIQYDLSPIGGPADGWLLENIFQEIDVESREVLFEWNATKHFKLDDTDKKFKGCHNDPRYATLCQTPVSLRSKMCSRADVRSESGPWPSA